MDPYRQNEPNNMKMPRWQFDICTTPRIELCRDGKTYCSSNDLTAALKGKNNAAVVALRNCSGVFCGLREAAMYGNANNNRLFLLSRICKPFFCAPTDSNVSVGLFKTVVPLLF